LPDPVNRNSLTQNLLLTCHWCGRKKPRRTVQSLGQEDMMAVVVAKKISISWILLGVVGVLGLLFAWFREGFDIGPSANLSYIKSIGFFVFATLSGIGATKNKLWGKVSLTIASILLALYCFLFLGAVWTNFGKLWFTVAWILFVFAIVSIPLIWIKRRAPTNH